MRNELSKTLEIMNDNKGQNQIAEVIISLAKILESQSEVRDEVGQKTYTDAVLTFGFHGANDVNRKNIEEGMFYADLSADTRKPHATKAGGVVVDLGSENAQTDNYPQQKNLEDFFVVATDKQTEAIKRLGEKINKPSPKSMYGSGKNGYGSSYIKFDRDYKTGKFGLVCGASYYDDKQRVNKWEYPYVTGNVMVQDSVELGGRSIAFIQPTELEAIICKSFANLADKTDFRMQEKGSKLKFMNVAISLISKITERNNA